MLVWCIACSSLQLLGFNLSDLCLSFGYLFYCINHYFCCSFKFFYWTLVCVSVWMQASLPISDVIQQNYAFSWCWVVKWVWYLCWFILLFMYVCRVILSILTVNMACNIILSESAFLNQLDAALVLLQGWYTFTCTNCCCVITCYSYLFLNLVFSLSHMFSANTTASQVTSLLIFYDYSYTTYTSYFWATAIVSTSYTSCAISIIWYAYRNI